MNVNRAEALPERKRSGRGRRGRRTSCPVKRDTQRWVVAESENGARKSGETRKITDRKWTTKMKNKRPK